MIKSFLSLYGWRYPMRLIALWGRRDRNRGYVARFWQIKDFSASPLPGGLTDKDRFIVAVTYTGMAAQIVAGLVLIWLWHARGLVGGWQFGLALLLAYPLVWAHVLPAIVCVWWLGHPKRLAREIICRTLESQVLRLRKRHTFKVVGVVGSIGKTSTKMAIARMLHTSRRVLWQEGNYNDRVTVPLIFFDQPEPSLFNMWAWLRIILRNERKLRRPYPYEIVIVELGPDGPGQMEYFRYLKLDLVVLTAITPEHMELFETLDGVAREELTALEFAKQALVNVDDTPAEYLQGRTFISYALQDGDYHITKRKGKGWAGQDLTFALRSHAMCTVHASLIGAAGAKITLAAVAAADLLGLQPADIEQGAASIVAFAGRMQILRGIKNSTIIDDSYNSSPPAAIAALDVLQDGEAPQRIAILGSMNELGSYSETAHREVAEHCDPTKLDWVVTVGDAARHYLAPIAKERGCQVKSFADPYQAGRFVKKHLQDGAIVLAKGSQNRVFTEESLKILLADKADEAKLVRQSAYWMRIKTKQFGPER